MMDTDIDGWSDFEWSMGSIKYMDIYKFVWLFVFGFLFYNLTDLYRRTRFPVGRMVSTLFCKSSIRTSFRWIKCSMRLILACRIWNRTSKFMELSHINRAYNYILLMQYVIVCALLEKSCTISSLRYMYMSKSLHKYMYIHVCGMF